MYHLLCQIFSAQRYGFLSSAGALGPLERGPRDKNGHEGHENGPKCGPRAEKCHEGHTLDDRPTGSNGTGWVKDGQTHKKILMQNLMHQDL